MMFRIGRKEEDIIENGITVICAGYNEEKGQTSFLKVLAMFDEIIFINRGCTDKTCEIAKKYNAIVVDMPHEIPEREHIESKKIINKVYNMASNRWVINLTFADIVHPKLYEKLIKTINKKDFDYTVVDVRGLNIFLERKMNVFRDVITADLY